MLCESPILGYGNLGLTFLFMRVPASVSGGGCQMFKRCRPAIVTKVMQAACQMWDVEATWDNAKLLTSDSNQNQIRSDVEAFLHTYDCKLLFLVKRVGWDPYKFAACTELFEKTSALFYDPALIPSNPELFQASQAAALVCLWFRRAFVYGPWHALVDSYGQHSRPVARSK